MALWKNKWFSAMAVTAAVTVFSAALSWWNPLETTHLRLSNLLFTRNQPSSDITIIAIDDKSLDEKASLGAFKDWSRDYYALLIQKLAIYKPAVIGFDLDWSKYSSGLNPFRIQQLTAAAERKERVDFFVVLKNLLVPGKHPDDLALAEALSKTPVMLGMDVALNKVGTNFLYGDAHWPVFEGLPVGFFNWPAGQDNVRRETLFSLNDATAAVPIVSFPSAIVKIFSPATVAESQPGSAALINFAARPGAYRTISFIDAFNGNFTEQDIKGKIILVGATAPILHDTVSVPNSPYPMPGVEVHANVIQQLLEGKYLADQSRFSAVAMIAALSFLEAVVMNAVPLMFAPLILLAISLLYAFGAKFSFDRGLLLNLIYPFLAFLLTFLGGVLVKYFVELREKRTVKKAFGHYVNKEVVAEILKHPENLKLGGEQKEVSVLFTDIVSFTTLAEKLDPQTLVGLLNEYLDAMAEVVLARGGTLDKFEGDAIMAFFGAPLENPLHAAAACQCALDMRMALSRLHEKWHREGKPLWDFCCGISTGQAVVGNLGSANRFDYTVIGDTVNLGARLESVNRQYGTKIIVDENTKNAALGFLFRKLDRVRVKGKSQPSLIFELLPPNSFSAEFLQDFETGIALYEAKNFADAQAHFESALRIAPHDGPSQIYRNRCDGLLKNPPPADWDGIVDIGRK